MSLAITFRSELKKSKRTSSIYLALIGGLLFPVILILDVIFGELSPENRKDVFNAVFTEGFKNTGFIFLPLFIVLISTLLPQLEFRNNAWKQVFASPQTKLNVFIAKFLNIQLLIWVFLIAHNIFMLIAAVIMHYIDASLHVLDQPLDVSRILVNNVNTYFALLPLGAIQFWMGLRFKNFIIPLGIGMSLWFIGTLMVLEQDWAYAKYFPYSLHVYSLFDKYKPFLPTVFTMVTIYTAAVLLIAFFDFRRKEHKA